MRFAITATDRYLGVFEAFLNAGWKPVKLFTAPVDNRMSHNKEVIKKAQTLEIPIQLSRLQDIDLEDLKNRGCEILIVASYQWRIGDWGRYLPYAVNFHPSPLPAGRGPYPLIKAVLDGWDHWGVTCHKLASKLDAGDILAQERFPLAGDECHESIDIKTRLAARKLAARVAARFEPLWHAASPQGEGSYWKLHSDADRMLDFNQPVADILRRIRAFGEHECVARVRDRVVFIRRAIGWQETHDLPPGGVTLNSTQRLVVTAGDGYIALLEWSVVGPDAQLGKTGR